MTPEEREVILERLKERNVAAQREWHESHHADPTHSCNFTKHATCLYCPKERSA